MALGALIIKEKLGLSDMETVEQIKEGSYLQYFIDLESFQYEAPFDASMLTHFRKRLKHADLTALQEELLQRHLEEDRRKAKGKEQDDDDADGGSTNKGKLIVDATCAPADIAYPTDIGLLNEAREKTEKIIDELCAMHPEGINRPRTYHRTARKDFLAVGMKLSISVVDDLSMPERMSWNAYNEGCDLVRDIGRYRERYGHYPESGHADKIYRTLANRMWCKDRGIRLSGVPLERPPKDIEKNRARRRQIREDEGIRNAVKGKFSQAKRWYGLGRVMARLVESSLSVVSITFLVMNLDRLLASPIFAPVCTAPFGAGRE